MKNIFDSSLSPIFRSKKLILTMLIVSMPMGHAQEKRPTELPLVGKDYLLSKYQGSFKIEHSDEFSRTSYASGRVAFNPNRNSVFVDSHVYQLGVGEFKIPDGLSTLIDKRLLTNAESLQDFVPLIERTDTGTKDGINRLGGMDLVEGDLVVQGYDSYDANGDAKQTTIVLREPSDLSGSEVDGFYEMEGAARTVNYLSPIPYEWRERLGGRYLAGNGGGMSIVTRNSEGPSLYIFDPDELSGSEWTVPTNVLMNYPAEHALSTALYQDGTIPGSGDWDIVNSSGKNDLWTEASVAAFGFIIPNTRTFMVVGSSGMHFSGGGYKITNDEGYVCGGFCAKDNEDYYTYYWMYDLAEILDAPNPWSVLPYEYGRFDDRWMEYNDQGGIGGVSGGSFDLASGTLVLSHRAATKSHESGSPILSVYKLPTNSPPSSPADLQVDVK